MLFDPLHSMFRLEQKYVKSRQASSELKEEMNTISQNYESHLRVMSEHLANVNEKLATQSEEIDKLRYQLNNKVILILDTHIIL